MSMASSFGKRLDPLGRGQSRTTRTCAEYERRFLQLDRRFCREAGQQWISAGEFVEALIALRPTLAARTWRVYKAAALWGLERYRDFDEHAIERLTPIGSGGLPARSQRTSGSKAKGVSVEAQTAVLAVLDTKHGRGAASARLLADMFVGSLATGLRPREWATAELVMFTDEPAALVVQNAKATNGRACGAERTIFVDKLSQGAVACIERVICFMRREATTEDALQRALSRLRSLLRSVRKRAAEGLTGPAKVQCLKLCLYSCRHQLVADAKSSDAPSRLTAALVGHATPETAAEHYGRKSQGRSPLIVRPSLETIAAVRDVAVRRRPRSPTKELFGLDPMS